MLVIHVNIKQVEIEEIKVTMQRWTIAQVNKISTIE